MTLKEWLAGKSLSAADAAAKANEKDVKMRGSVTVPELAAHINTRTSLCVTLARELDNPKQTVADAAYQILRATESAQGTIELDDQGFSAALGALVSEGVITQTQRDGIEALGDSLVSLSDQNGWGRVRVGDIQRARA